MHQPARRVLAAALMAIFAGLAGFGLPAPAKAQIAYNQLLFSEQRYAAIVVDANTGEVLYSRYADALRHPASISKLMTLYLTFEQLQSGRLKLSDTITVSSHAASMAPTKLGVRAGDTVTVDQAVQAAAIKSANDMAVALAEKVGGSEERFGALMTLRAKELGMTNSNFVNASGLPDNRQIASARDIAILSRALMRDFPQYYHYFSQRQFAFRGQVINGHNHLLDMMPGVDGLKTGYTNASGFNIATSAVQNGRRLIAVVMGGSSAATRDNHMEDLLQAGFTVMARRDRGEVVQFAQNLFEPDPGGAISRPMVEQGDADQRGVQIVVDQALPRTVAPYSSTVYGVAPGRTSFTPPAARRQLQIVSAPPLQAMTITKAAPDRDAKPSDRKLAETTCVNEDAKDRSPRAKSRGRGETPKKGKPCESAVAKVAERDEADRNGRLGKAARKSDDGGWVVQVGAYRDRAAAKSQISKVAKSVDGLRSGQSSVDGASNGYYRARFSGLSATAARSACASLKAKGQSCMAYEG